MKGGKQLARASLVRQPLGVHDDDGHDGRAYLPENKSKLAKVRRHCFSHAEAIAVGRIVIGVGTAGIAQVTDDGNTDRPNRVALQVPDQTLIDFVHDKSGNLSFVPTYHIETRVDDA